MSHILNDGYCLPLHVGEYLTETRRMTPSQRDGYLHLMMVYWTKGSLPDDDAQLARIAGMSPNQWRRSKSVIKALFSDGWRHDRLDQIWEEAQS